ncbi:MAG: hypothetical protein K2L88_05815 [Clostridiales bacterium]|nr:hypothetical protein [Clostridiales bacterium]
MKSVLEKELSERSFFDESYIRNRLEREAADKVPVSARFIESDGARFVLLARFHDARIIEIVNTQKYGNDCVIIRIDFRGTTTEFKKGYRKFDIYLMNAEYIETPTKYKELHVIGLDCMQESQSLIIGMESVYFTGEQEHKCTCKIRCNGIDVKSCD